MKARYVIPVALSALLVACGGGGSGGSLGADSGSVSVFVTDNLTLDYSEVWVTLKEISATSSTGSSVTLYQNTTGQAVNLATLAGAAELINTASLTAGTYTRFDVDLGNDIVLIKNDGSTVNAQFGVGASDFSISVNGSLTVTNGQATSFALDFDLANFTYDAGTGLVSPTVVFVDDSSVDNLARTYARIEGSVVAVSSTNEFTLRPEHSSTTVTVSLSGNAVVVDESTGNAVSTTTGLSVGDEVYVYGNYSANSMTIDAVTVQVDDSTDSSSDTTNTKEVEGVIVSVDVGGGSLVLDVREANFVPTSNTVNVINLTNATFYRGDFASLSAGQWVEIKGTWDGSNFTATLTEIEGMPSSADDNYGSATYTEIEGYITAVTGSDVTVTVTETNSGSFSVSSAATVDVSNAWFKTGSASCLTVGTAVDLKGQVNGSSLDVTTVEFESGSCAVGS